MNITLKRVAMNQEYTVGNLFVDGKYFCDTLEDPVRDINKNGVFDGAERKIYGNTAIPFGKYKVVLTQSPKFKRVLPRLQNVPSFEGILIHSGNTAKDTDGCILVGVNSAKGQLTNSRATLEKLMAEMKARVASGEDIYISLV